MEFNFETFYFSILGDGDFRFYTECVRYFLYTSHSVPEERYLS